MACARVPFRPRPCPQWAPLQSRTPLSRPSTMPWLTALPAITTPARTGSWMGDPTAAIVPVDFNFFCPIMGLSGPTAACLAQDIVERTLAGLAETKCPTPNAGGYGAQIVPADQDTSGNALPKPFGAIAGPLPAAFNETEAAALLDEEQATWHWLLTTVLNLSIFQFCEKGNGGGLKYLMPANWGPVGGKAGLGIYYLTQPKKKELAKDLLKEDPNPKNCLPPRPVMSILRQADGAKDQLAVAVRGTATNSEWMRDFKFTMVKDQPFPGPQFNGSFHQGLVHRGFLEMFKELWPPVYEALEKEVLGAAGGAGGVKHVYLAGHSLGAGVATLLTHAAAKWAIARGVSDTITINAALFAAPILGDAAHASDAAFRQTRSRRLAFVNDLVPMIPCEATGAAKGMPACKNTLIRSDDPDDPTRVWWNEYKPGYATLHVQPAMMPAQPAAWGRTNAVPAAQLGQYFVGTHVCSYVCLVSAKTKGMDASRDICLLEDVQDRSVLKTSSFCTNFPVFA
ncbi:MAG: Alpha/Beta hydrolase protein [Monoraphidium minutum]|nr:MAG: Alpha/Beta hydrolase protein [Monoraphidium minutum]